jgi:hypothetical protein
VDGYFKLFEIACRSKQFNIRRVRVHLDQNQKKSG